MQIFPATQNDLPQLKAFLLPHEHKCVQLASYVRKNRENVFFIKDDDEICGVFYAKGTFLHCIPRYSDRAHAFNQILGSFLRTHPIKCVNGERTVTQNIKLLVGSPAAQINSYKLFTLAPGKKIAEPPQPLAPYDQIFRLANPEHDCETLFELQKKYIKEEVAPAGKNPSNLEINVILKQILKNQICLALFTDKQPASKANTNAIGWNCVQIGGVYTNPLYRRNGYAWHLVYNLCQRILRTQKTAVLYVKQKNTAALELYKKIGFEECADFEIAYF